MAGLKGGGRTEKQAAPPENARVAVGAGVGGLNARRVAGEGDVDSLARVFVYGRVLSRRAHEHRRQETVSRSALVLSLTLLKFHLPMRGGSAETAAATRSPPDALSSPFHWPHRQCALFFWLKVRVLAAAFHTFALRGSMPEAKKLATLGRYWRRHLLVSCFCAMTARVPMHLSFLTAVKPRKLRLVVYAILFIVGRGDHKTNYPLSRNHLFNFFLPLTSMLSLLLLLP